MVLRGTGGASDLGSGTSSGSIGTTGRGASALAELILHPSVDDSELKQGEHTDHDEQQPRHRGGVAHAEVTERLGVELEVVNSGRLPRAASGHQIDDVEHLERSDDLEDDDEEGGGSQKRPRHAAELPPPAGAVQLRRLVEILRDGLQTGQEDDHAFT